MRPMNLNQKASTEVAILARLLGDEEGALTPALARHILNRRFSEDDKNRMHELAVRNQNDRLSKAEKQELLAYAKAGTVLSILKSKARQILRSTNKKRSI